MKLFKKIAAVILGCIALLNGFGLAGCGEKGDDMMKNAPDYSNSEYKLDMYAHCSPSNGHYTDKYGKPQYAGEDFRTEERFQEYKDMGLDTLLLLGNDPYNGEKFETSQLKKNLDNAQKAGLKVIVFDLRIHDLSSNVVGGEQQDSLVGDGKQFATQTDLENHLRELTKDYIGHPAFYGVTLFDEPGYVKLKSVGQVYRALHTIKPDIYVPVVLVPYMNETGWIPHYTGEAATGDNVNPQKAYEKYVAKYFEETGANNLLYDDYPFRFRKGTENSEFIRNTYLANLQIMSEAAQQHGARLELIVQTFSMNAGLRKVTEEDVRWQVNTALSFGVQNIIYFTYWMFPNQTQGPNLEGIDSAIMDNFGNKVLYDEVQGINVELQNLAKIIFNYKYQKSYYNFTSIAPPTYFVGLADVENLDGIEEIEIEETTLINQMYDEEKGLYGYFILNETDPFFKKENKVTVKFADEYKYLMVVNRGEATYRKLDKNNSAVFELDVGDGCFVIPYN